MTCKTIIERFLSWFVPKILYLCGFLSLLYAMIVAFFPTLFDNLGMRLPLALSFMGVGIAIIAFTRNSVTMPKIIETLERIKTSTVCTEDIRREINLNAIEYKIRLNRIEEKIDNLAPNAEKKQQQKDKITPISYALGFCLMFGIVFALIAVFNWWVSSYDNQYLRAAATTLLTATLGGLMAKMYIKMLDSRVTE